MSSNNGNYSVLPPFMIEGALKKIVQTGDKKSARIADQILKESTSDYDVTNSPEMAAYRSHMNI